MNEPQIEWPVSIAENHYQLSYVIRHHDAELLGPPALLEALGRINREVRDLVWTGWSMFYPFTRSEIAPKTVPENADGSGAYLLETNLALDTRVLDTTLPDFWRVSPKGWATVIRPYREDRTVFDAKRQPGKWFSPETPLRETAELVRHAYLFSKYFATTEFVEFDCTWKGLKGREIADFNPAIYWSPGRVAHTNVRRTEGKWPAAELLHNWPSVVAALACPVLEIFELDFCTVEFVEGMAERFKKLPSNVD